MDKKTRDHLKAITLDIQQRGVSLRVPEQYAHEYKKLRPTVELKILPFEKDHPERSLYDIHDRLSGGYENYLKDEAIKKIKIQGFAENVEAKVAHFIQTIEPSFILESSEKNAAFEGTYKIINPNFNIK